MGAGFPKLVTSGAASKELPRFQPGGMAATTCCGVRAPVVPASAPPDDEPASPDELPLELEDPLEPPDELPLEVEDPLEPPDELPLEVEELLEPPDELPLEVEELLEPPDELPLEVEEPLDPPSTVDGPPPFRPASRNMPSLPGTRRPTQTSFDSAWIRPRGTDSASSRASSETALKRTVHVPLKKKPAAPQSATPATWCSGSGSSDRLRFSALGSGLCPSDRPIDAGYWRVASQCASSQELCTPMTRCPRSPAASSCTGKGQPMARATPVVASVSVASDG